MRVSQLQKRHGLKFVATSLREPFSYCEALAVSLILYAKSDSEFAKLLKKRVYALPRFYEVEVSPHAIGGVEILLPHDRESALRRAEWLVQGIAENRFHGASPAAARLIAWADEKVYQSPKQIVVGVAVVAIPGVTLGRFKTRVKMTVITRRDLVLSKNADLADKITKASLDILARALDMAGGNSHKLEPEVGDWFFGDREMSFYAADGAKLSKIERELDDLDIVHAVVEDVHGIAILAITPVLDSIAQETRWKLGAF